MKYIKTYESAPSKNDGVHKYNVDDIVVFRPNGFNKIHYKDSLDEIWTIVRADVKYERRFTPPYVSIKKNVYDLQSGGYIYSDIKEALIRRIRGKKELEEFEMRLNAKKYNI